MAAIKAGVLDAVVVQRQVVFGEIAIKKIYDHNNGSALTDIGNSNTYEINRSKGSIR